MSGAHPVLAAFAPLPLLERLFVRARLASAPLERLAAEARGPRVLEVGCGHGLLCALVARALPGAEVVGVDVDPRKVAWARASVGRLPGVRVETGPAEALLPREAGRFHTVLIADVLYLLPAEAQLAVLQTCRRLLVQGGRLLLEEAEDDGGWRARKALCQERLMVRILGRTQGSGGLGFQPRRATTALLERAGFRVDEVSSWSRQTTTPHVRFLATSL
jgi:2-polyprenyl-6-hydroxyphenyl methylase/3-demethylubiquinone-9 3-methyltransferase